MKKLIYLFSITVVLTVFTSVTASAKTLAPSSSAASVAPGVMCDLLGGLFGGGNNNNNNNNGGNNGGSTQLPINGGVEFLMLAGAIIGVATVQRHKVAKTAAVQE